MFLTAVVIANTVVFQSSLSAQDLEPRVPLPKLPLVLHTEYPQLLAVKFTDAFQGRAAEDGSIVSLSNADASEVIAVAAAFGITFQPATGLPQTVLDALQAEAAIRSGMAQPDLGGVVYARLEVETPADLLAAGNALQALDDVEFVCLEPLDVPPPTHENHVPSQGYRRPGAGADFDLAWTRGASRGEGVRLIDCEYEWHTTHVDLQNASITPGSGMTGTSASIGRKNHGTAVLGVLCAEPRNLFGCDGLAPDADVHILPQCFIDATDGNSYHRYDCILRAGAVAEPGDVVLLEMQTPATMSASDFVPVEYVEILYTAIKNATDRDVIVVEPAGNGSQNLNDAMFSTYMSMADSQAIIVGAGTNDATHARIAGTSWGSTYGDRVNVQAWGQGVTTLGNYPSDSSLGADPDDTYTLVFNGTSSASAIVAAACAVLQSYAVDRLCRRLTPSQMRTVLVDSGTPTATGSPGGIGPMINVPAAQAMILALYVSDCQFRRGDANDDGWFNISDAIWILNYLHNEGPPPPCLEAADVNDDALLLMADALNLVNWLFLGTSPPPSPPHPNCGPDPVTSPDNIGCAASLCP